jgi:hypothetical protein
MKMDLHKSAFRLNKIFSSNSKNSNEETKRIGVLSWLSERGQNEDEREREREKMKIRHLHFGTRGGAEVHVYFFHWFK